MSKLFNQKAIGTIRNKKKKWLRETYQDSDERDMQFETLSGLPIEPLYTPEHVADLDYLNDLGFPGQEPYIRGVHATMYRGRTWGSTWK